MEGETLIFDDVTRQRDTLQHILSTGDKDDDLELDEPTLADNLQGGVESESQGGVAKRTTLAKMSGRTPGTMYREGKPKQRATRASQKDVHPFFRSFYKNR